MVAAIASPQFAFVVYKIAGPQPTIPPVAGGEELIFLTGREERQQFVVLEEQGELLEAASRRVAY